MKDVETKHERLLFLFRTHMAAEPKCFASCSEQHEARLPTQDVRSGSAFARDITSTG
ncbi:hypothetical protein SAMN04488054_11456 [Salibacterium qingdaonense]|uniref:Uncharacterized protein n=1 Tax=Salibacterium qingdaonense TaxID=266892 RepID=A0A1I4N059_9BACI|nr:hypothetical protein SAMN04488054_11456 [Salibacterium qingdaonense]